MDLAPTFHDVVRIARAALDPASGWHSLVDYLEQHGLHSLPQLRSVDVQEDVRRIRRQLVELIEGEPPPKDLNAVYFGLFDTSDEEGAEGIGYYIAGVRRFDPEDGDSLCHPAWWPEGRYLSSSALDSIKDVELSFVASGEGEKRALLGYAGQLGAALLVSHFASKGLLPDLRRVVGFDSGDFAEITT
jgi:hypothetical protein